MKGNYTKSDHFEIIDTLPTTHHYCITPRHVAWASDKFSGRLGEDAIRDGEAKAQIRCGVRGCNLTFDEHELCLLVACYEPATINGKNNPELEALLKENVAECEANKYVGFAFVDKTGEGQ